MIIGEETGGANDGTVAGIYSTQKLPNSKLKLPIGLFLVQPNIEFTPYHERSYSRCRNKAYFSTNSGTKRCRIRMDSKKKSKENKPSRFKTLKV